jgi:hypothetical protein
MYKLHGLKFFSKLESRLRYYQVRMCKEDIEKKKKMMTHNGHYKFKIIVFGLTNTPATFQALMNNKLEPY